MNNLIQLKKIEKTIDTMSLDSLTVIYNILKKNNEPITRKSDCFLINLGTLHNNTVNEILNFITFIEENKILLEKDELEKEEYKTNYLSNTT
jgi:hypothetical protein